MLEIETLAHEIINPLNIIVGCAELSKIKNNHKDKQINEYLDLILNQSKECCTLLNEKIQNWKNNKYSPFEVHQVIKNNIKKQEENPITKEKNITFLFKSIFNSKIDNIKLQKNLNLTYLKIIINNLLLNSIKYSKDSTKIFVNLSLTDNNLINIYIKNELETNQKQDFFKKSCVSNNIGLNLIDNLINLLNADWEIIQNNNFIETNIFL